MELSPDQQKAHDALIDFLDQRGELITMGGYAGTGKTTVLAETIKTFSKKHNGRRPNIAFCAFTGKASMVMGQKLVEAGALNKEDIKWEEGEGDEKKDHRIKADYCGTIHSLMYKPVYDGHKLIGWVPADDLPYDFIVVDEASMVPEAIHTDMLEYGIPIIAVGDHGQLPPVKDTFNLMEHPQIRLEKIHRQAEDNPIIKLSMMAREHGKIPFGEYGQFVHKVRGIKANLDNITFSDDMMILCGTNRSRVSINDMFRRKKGITDKTPQPGEKVICLKNNKKAFIYNGMTGIVESIDELSRTQYQAKIKMDYSALVYEGGIFKPQFGCTKSPSEFAKTVDWRTMGDCFDYGYCLTVHKSQGSESNMVVLCEEYMPYMEPDVLRRWLYTGITRSREKLLILAEK